MRSLIDRGIWNASVDALGFFEWVGGVASLICVETGFLRIVLFVDLHFFL